MSASFIGDVSFLEVCVNVCRLYIMLEELKKKSRQKYHNVVVEEGGNKVHISCHNVDYSLIRTKFGKMVYLLAVIDCSLDSQ